MSDLFEERQKIDQPWVIVLISLPALFATWGLIQQLLLRIPWGSKPVPDILLLCIWFICIGMVYITLDILVLETEVSPAGISYRYPPFINSARQISWEEVVAANVITYRPILENGGWGIRWGKYGKAYTMRGNRGLYIELKSGKSKLIGTSKPYDLKNVINKLKESGYIHDRKETN